MTSLLIVLAIFLLVAGAAMLGMTMGVMRVDQRDIARRVNIILAKAQRRDVDTTLGQGRTRNLLRSIMSTGIQVSWTSKTPTQILLVAAMCGGALLWGVLFIGLHAPMWIWAPATLIGMMAPPQMLLRMEQGRLETKFVDVFPDAIDMIVRMLRAGLPMTAAIGIVGREAGSPVKEVFAAVGDQMTMGASFDKALLAAGKQIRPQDFKFFTVAAALQQATGGNLTSTLEMLSEIIRKRRAGRMKAKAVSSEARMSAYVLAAIPFFVIGAMLMINPAYLLPLVQDKRGYMIIGLGVGMLSAGFFTMSQMMKSATRV